MYKIEVVADQNDLCGESPLWNLQSQKLYWVDITGKQIRTYSYDTGAVTSKAPGIAVSALALTGSDSLIGAGAEGVWALPEGPAPVSIAKEHMGESLAINDTVADPRGRLLAGSTFFDNSTGGYPLGKLYCLHPDGTITVLDDGFLLANGMGFSPDARTLYATDSIARVIYAYDYDVESGAARNKRTFVKVPSTEGLPDGLTVDADAFVWSAQWFGSCVCRYDPAGTLRERIAIPAEQVSSVTFGGREFSEVFITSAGQPDALAFAPPGYTPSAEKVGGQLFRFRANVQGRPEYSCRIQPGLHSDAAN